MSSSRHTAHTARLGGIDEDFSLCYSQSLALAAWYSPQQNLQRCTSLCHRRHAVAPQNWVHSAPCHRSGSYPLSTLPHGFKTTHMNCARSCTPSLTDSLHTQGPGSSCTQAATAAHSPQTPTHNSHAPFSLDANPHGTAQQPLQRAGSRDPMTQPNHHARQHAHATQPHPYRALPHPQQPTPPNTETLGCAHMTGAAGAVRARARAKVISSVVHIYRRTPEGSTRASTSPEILSTCTEGK